MKKLRLLVLTFTIAAVAVLWYAIVAKNVIFEWITFASAYIKDSELGILIFILLAAISTMLSPFSSVPLAPIAIVTWGPLATTLMLVVGWTIGGMLSYVIGKRYGYEIATKFIEPKKFDKWSSQIEKKVNFFMMLVFRVMTPSETGYIFGIIRYPFGKFLLVTFLSELPFALAISYGGNAIISREKEFFIIAAIVSVIFFPVFYHLYKKEFKKFKE